MQPNHISDVGGVENNYCGDNVCLIGMRGALYVMVKGGGGEPTCDKRTSRHLEAVYHAFPREHTRRLACLTILHHLILALGDRLNDAYWYS